jgi:hypothetical protein
MEPEGLLPHLQEPATCPYPEPNQSNPCHLSHVLKIRFNIILPSMPVSSTWCLPLRLSLHYPVCTSLAPPITFFFIYYPNNIWLGVQIIKLTIQFFHSPLISSLLGPNVFLSILFSNTRNLSSPLSLKGQLSLSYKTTEKLYFCIF